MLNSCVYPFSYKSTYTFQARQFIDFKRVSVSGGDGGDGRLSFLSLPYKEWAGPDGGNGGNGGHIIFKGKIVF